VVSERGWSDAKLGAVAQVDRAVVAPDRIPRGTRYIGLEHIAGDGTLVGVRVLDIGELRSTKFAFSDRHVLFGKLRPYLRKVARPTFSGVCSTDILAILPGPDLDRDFLYHSLRQPRIISLATSRSEGANLPRLSPKALLDFPISLPPLAEQRRIAAVLDRADAIRRKRRKSLLLVDELLRSTFLELFGDPLRNEKGWEIGRFDSVIRSIQPGSSVKEGDGTPGPADWAVLKISAVTSGQYLPNEAKVVRAPPERLVVPIRGDLLFSRANTRELVAATCIVDHDAPRVFLPDKLWKITPHADVATVEYLKYLLTEPRFRKTLTRLATGTSGSMLNVSQDKFLRLRLPIPPFVLQKRFTKQVWKVYDIRAECDQALNQSEKLFDSLAQQAFRGAVLDS